MSISLLLCPATSLSSQKQPIFSSSLFSLKTSSFPALTNHRQSPRNQNTNRRRPITITVQSKGRNSADAPDRLISAICYFYPFFDGIQYGKYVLTQFTPIQVLIEPLVPAIKAIVLDVLLIFPDLLERSFNPRDGVGLDLMMSLDSTVFLFLLVCLIYGSSSCLLGQVPRLPIVAEAAERQVP
ncbi:Chloroplast protein import component Tic20 [Dillenia turbinata]|uniref:Protein TIC 20 n=1 Tax=Dillenia turbinata TaxID=194707 RepID=A0AAN8VV03_9MAGN